MCQDQLSPCTIYVYIHICQSFNKQYYLRPIRRQRLNNVNVGPSGQMAATAATTTAVLSRWSLARCSAARARERESESERDWGYIVICHRFNNSALFMFTRREFIQSLRVSLSPVRRARNPAAESARTT